MINLNKKLGKKLVCVVGPTAVGKSAVALELARTFHGEIINADSRQIYRELSIGTAKPSSEVLCQVPHHLINCASIEKPWTVATFIEAAEKSILEIQSRGSLPILVGGTGMYVKKLLFGLDAVPQVDDVTRAEVKKDFEKNGLVFLYEELKRVDLPSAERLSQNDTQRILRALEVYRYSGKSITDFWQKENQVSRYDYLKLGLKAEREVLYQNINQRVHEMISQGLKKEAQELFNKYAGNDVLLKTIGYAEWAQFGFDDEGVVVTEIQKNSRRFAKRQLTWFGNESDVEWFDSTQIDELKRQVENFFLK